MEFCPKATRTQEDKMELNIFQQNAFIIHLFQ